MPAQYYAIATLAGQAKIAAAVANQGAIEITAVAAGDGNGAPVTPLETMAGLVHEVWRGAPTSVGRDPAAPTQVLITAVIPDTAAPATIRELALFTADGQCFAVANYPATDLAAPSQGAVNSIEVVIPIVIDTAANVSVTVTVNQSEIVRVERLGRAPFISVDGIFNDPPANPAANALVVVGAAPTGAFADEAHRFAQWSGVMWMTAAAHVGTIVHDIATGLYWKRTAGGWIEWRATAAEIDAGAETSKIVVPADLAAFVDLAGATAGVAAAGPVKSRLAEAMARYASLGRVFNCAGAANAYTLTSKGGAIIPVSPFDGQTVEFTPSATNTGASTVTWAGVTKSIRNIDGTTLAPGQLVVGRPTQAIYSPAANGGAGALLLMPWADALFVKPHNAVPNFFEASLVTPPSCPNNAYVTLTGLTLGASQFTDSVWNGNSLTIGAKDAGMWDFSMKIVITTCELYLYVARNAANSEADASDGYLNELDYGRRDTASGGVRVFLGDVIDFRVYQRNQAGAARSISSGYITGHKIKA